MQTATNAMNAEPAVHGIQGVAGLKVAIDDGFAMTKVVVYDDKGFRFQTVIPSRARTGGHGATVLGDFSARSAVFPGYETEGIAYTVGDFNDAESTQFNGYPFSGLNRAIIAHALRVAGLGGHDINIATGLPLSLYYQGGTPNDVVITQKILSLNKPICAMDGSTMANIKSHTVYPEGLSAFIDYAVDDHGGLRIDLAKETIGIVDIGGRTTDIAVVIPSSTVDHARSGSENIGVLDVLESLRTQLEKRFKSQIPPHLIENALHTRNLLAWGKDHDVSKEIDISVAEVLDRIMRDLDRQFGSGIDLSRIVLVGGGARLFERARDRYPQIYIPKDAEFANARGYAKLMGL